jgi:transcriptional regulator with XRE-family HTH domain
MDTADQLIGERIHHLMWRQRISQTRLAAMLGMTQGALSKKVHGERPWFASELIAVAKALNTQVSALLPIEFDPDPPVVPLPRLDSNQQPFDHSCVDVA